MIVPYDYMQNLNLIIMAFLSYCKFIRIASGRKRRRIWTKDIFDKNEREMHGFYKKFFLLIKERDSDQFRTTCNMGVSQFEQLFTLLKPKLTKHSPRTPIQAECRLVLTLTFLTQGLSWKTLALAFRLGVSTVREIILETCDAIAEELDDIDGKRTEEEWNKTEVEIYNTTGMPNCVGAIDARLFKIKFPHLHSKVYFDYKKYNSIAILGACDSNYCFTAVDIGAYGVESDGSILVANGFGKQILGDELNLPCGNIPNSDVKCPFYFVGNPGLPLKNHIMRPYPKKNVASKEDSFNTAIAKVESKIENTFGILITKWKVLHNSINCFPHNAAKIIRATVVLHNFAKKNDPSYCPPNYVDQEDGDNIIKGRWRYGCPPIPQCKLFSRFNAARSAIALRDNLKEYVSQKVSENV